MEMNEKEAWEYLAQQYELETDFVSERLSGKGICLALSRLADKDLITWNTYKAMKHKFIEYFEPPIQDELFYYWSTMDDYAFAHRCMACQLMAELTD